MKKVSLFLVLVMMLACNVKKPQNGLKGQINYEKVINGS